MRLELAAVAALSVLAAACGGIESEPNLAKAVKRTEATGSSRIEVRAAETAFGRESEIRCDGIADYMHRRLRLLCGAYGDFIAIDETLYLRGSTAVLFGGGDRWLKIEDSDPGTSVHDLSPVTLLAMLRAASRESERLGEEEVRGVPTVGYRLTVQCEEAELACEGETAPVDVWIDGDGLVRRLFLESGGTAGTIEFFDFGVDADIEPPPPGQVDDVDQLAARPCKAGGGSPVTDDAALDVLRRHGFAMEREEECGGHVASLLLGPVGNGADAGFLTCRVYGTPPSAAPTSPRTTTFTGTGSVSLENLECSLIFLGGAGEDALSRLEEAFADLERSIRP
jgi:hypothetical protein